MQHNKIQCHRFQANAPKEALLSSLLFVKTLSPEGTGEDWAMHYEVKKKLRQSPSGDQPIKIMEHKATGRSEGNQEQRRGMRLTASGDSHCRLLLSCFGDSRGPLAPGPKPAGRRHPWPLDWLESCPPHSGTPLPALLHLPSALPPTWSKPRPRTASPPAPREPHAAELSAGQPLSS